MTKTTHIATVYESQGTLAAVVIDGIVWWWRNVQRASKPKERHRVALNAIPAATPARMWTPEKPVSGTPDFVVPNQLVTNRATDRNSDDWTSAFAVFATPIAGAVCRQLAHADR